MAERRKQTGRQQGGTALVIFGITGDLAHRKLVPAMVALTAEGRLPSPLYLVGFARRSWSADMLLDEFRPGVEESLEGDALDIAVLERLFSDAHRVRAEFHDEAGYNA